MAWKDAEHAKFVNGSVETNRNSVTPERGERDSRKRAKETRLVRGLVSIKKQLI